MTISLTLLARAAMLTGFDNAVRNGAGSAHVLISQGTTELVHFHLGATVSFGTAHSDSISLTGALPFQDTGPSVAGKANRFAIHSENDDEVLSGVLSTYGGGGDVETTGITVTASTDQFLNGLTLRMSSGGIVTVEMSLTLT